MLGQCPPSGTLSLFFSVFSHFIMSFQAFLLLLLCEKVINDIFGVLPAVLHVVLAACSYFSAFKLHTVCVNTCRWFMWKCMFLTSVANLTTGFFCVLVFDWHCYHYSNSGHLQNWTIFNIMLGPLNGLSIEMMSIGCCGFHSHQISTQLQKILDRYVDSAFHHNHTPTSIVFSPPVELSIEAVLAAFGSTTPY